MSNFDEIAVSDAGRGIVMGLIISVPLWAIIIGIWYWVVH